MTNDTKTDRLLRPDEVAERLGVSERTLERWRAAGQGPAFVTIGRMVRYAESAVAGFVETLEGRRPK